MKIINMALIALFIFFIIVISLPSSLTDPSLNERLGYEKSDKLLIINGDDAGMCHSINQAIFESFETGLMTSASIMVPTPGFKEVVEYAVSHPERDFGIHITLTSEWESNRSPISDPIKVYSLITPFGFFWPETRSLNKYGISEHVELESVAQIERALSFGIDITHINSHMDSLKYNRKFIPILLKLALKYNVPLRLCSPWDRDGVGFNKKKLKDYGLVFPDHLVYEPYKTSETFIEHWKKLLKSLKPGVSELYIHPAIETEEIKMVAKPDWQIRVEEFNLFTKNIEIKNIVKSQKIILINYRKLRDLQRNSKNLLKEPFDIPALNSTIIDNFSNRDLYLCLTLMIFVLTICVIKLTSKSNKIVGVLFSPRNTFNEILQNNSLSDSIFIIICSGIILSSSIVLKTYNEMDDFANGYSYYHAIRIIIFSFLLLLSKWLSKFIFIYIIGVFARKELGWQSLLSMTGYTLIPEVLLESIIFSLALLSGLSFQMNPWFSNVIKIGLFWPNYPGPYTIPEFLLSQIGLFTIWSLFLTIILIKLLFKISTGLATITSGIFYIIIQAIYYLSDKYILPIIY